MTYPSSCLLQENLGKAKTMSRNPFVALLSSLAIEHGKPWAVKWGRLYTLTTCVKSATEVKYFPFEEHKSNEAHSLYPLRCDLMQL